MNEQMKTFYFNTLGYSAEHISKMIMMYVHQSNVKLMLINQVNLIGT